MRIPTLLATTALATIAIAIASAQQPAAVHTQQPPAKAPATSQPSGPAKPFVLERSTTRVLAERIAKQIAAASPMADPADAAERDLAGARLAASKDLIDAADGKILWGGFNPAQGYDPEQYRLTRESPLTFAQLTELDPTVWAKLYLSTFMFSGKYEIREENGLTIVEMDAKFRGDLSPGDYPYPFWHSPNKWTAYMNAGGVLLVFERRRLIAAMRDSPLPEKLKLIRRPWDAKWSWVDESGNPQPRVALFDYLFAKDNPHVAPLEKSYRELEERFRAENCMSCHQPDNQSKINDLLLLNYPNQALVMRRSIVKVFEENYMPPGDKLANAAEGVQDRKLLAELLRLSREFEKNADAAIAYEREHAQKK